jgi:3-hydroxyacyl-CoA dehydrogenase
MADTPVRLETDGDVGIVVIDHPPANTLSHKVRAGLRDAVRALAADPALRAGIIIGANRIFISGADINEFSGPVEQPDLPAVIAEIENCVKPIVAAIEGAALGGGLEVALGCDAQIATEDAMVGLPEVTLGVIPGSGGTQRLPRLTGIAQAIALIASGKRMSAAEAEKLGIIDKTVKDGVREAAIAHARGMQEKRRVSALPVQGIEELEAAVAEQTRRARSNAARAAIEITALAATLPFAEAAARERETFLALRDSEEAAALRHLFFAERAARKVDAGGASPLPVKSVGIVGAGTMGAGIAAAFAASGLSVIIYDAAPEARERGAAAVRAALADLSRPEAGVTFSDQLSALANCDLIIEAVFEDMGVKAAVMRELGVIAKPDAILATNTSYLDLDALAEAGGRPAHTLGLHFFAPAHRMKLLEIVRGAGTAPATLLTGIEMARRLGKIAVVARPSEGFIGNRIFAKYRAQAEMLLEEGATPREVDAAAEALGFAMGPFAVNDLAGLDIAWRMRKSKAATRDPRERYVQILDRLCEMGRLGRKAGAGWYDYDDGGKGRGRESPVVASVIDELRPARFRDSHVDAAVIRARLLGAIVNEATNVLSDGIARAPGDIDVVLVNGYGFSRLKGGPLFQAARLPRAEVEAMIDLVEEAVGFGFRRGDLSRALGGG